MAQSPRRLGGPIVKNTLLLSLLCLEYGGLSWCAAVYLPRIEEDYRERLAPREVPGEARSIFRLAHGVSRRPLLVAAGFAVLALLEGVAIASRRFGVFDFLYFVLVILLALAFLFGYLSLAVPLIGAGKV